MEMINLREAPLVDKPEDGATLFALNQDGSINRIKADGVGGSKIHYIDIDFSSLGGEVSPESLSTMKARISSPSPNLLCTCDTLTYEEAKAAILAGEHLNLVARGQIILDEQNVWAEVIPIVSMNITRQGVSVKDGDDAEDQATEAITLAGICNTFQSILPIKWTKDGACLVLS